MVRAHACMPFVLIHNEPGLFLYLIVTIVFSREQQSIFKMCYFLVCCWMLKDNFFNKEG
jgi:hypothetical protein